ncbi:hypothetical protein LguiA_017219 [Lonicera macranthoides]
MDSCGFDIFEIYRRFSEITSRAYVCGDEDSRPGYECQKPQFSKRELAQLLILAQSMIHTRISIFDEVFKLMSGMDLMVDFSEFSRFYDFVFFICRENGQKNITVSRAVMAWRLVLAGRFRLLNQWCDFVERKQRHNISEDTWRQVLAFTRCVHENLEGYDPEGAWPTLIDDFVEHMHRTAGLIDTASSYCNCGDTEAQPCDDPLPGLKIAPGLKRKLCEEFQRFELGSGNYNIKSKRRHGDEKEKHISSSSSSQFGCSKSQCAVEGILVKGFEGLFSTRSGLQFDHQSRVSSHTSYT